MTKKTERRLMLWISYTATTTYQPQRQEIRQTGLDIHVLGKMLSSQAEENVAQTLLFTFVSCLLDTQSG
jgi:hypothetical protein